MSPDIEFNQPFFILPIKKDPYTPSAPNFKAPFNR